MSSWHAVRAVFASPAGGVGRTASVLASAWALAEENKRVLAVDLDFGSPSLSHSLLFETDSRPAFGTVDWLAGDAVPVPADIVAEVAVQDKQFMFVPSCGTNADGYIGKLQSMTARSGVTMYLRDLLNRLEERFRPDVTLIEAPAGLDGFASSCMAGLDADRLFLFVSNKVDVWRNYDMLFRHWEKTGILRNVRERIQLVGSMLPCDGRSEYYAELRENAWNLFLEHIYDVVPAGEPDNGYFSFDLWDREAPHYPLPVFHHEELVRSESFMSWIRGLSNERAARRGFENIADELERVFGNVVGEIKGCMADPDVPDIHVGNIGTKTQGTQGGMGFS